MMPIIYVTGHGTYSNLLLNEQYTRILKFIQTRRIKLQGFTTQRIP